MRCSNCGICCTETEMLLTLKDIKRLENKGFSRNYFAEIDKEGYAVLKNQNGYCVFYNLKTRLCSVYDERPSGCRIYPVVLDEEKGIVFDEICDSCKSITVKEKKVKGKEVIKLLEEIDAEAENRRSQVS
jgi:Fe-S-cluster containining protein